jgi:hypothetical protein
MDDRFEKLRGYTCLVRKEDLTSYPDMIDELTASGIKIVTLDENEVEELMEDLGVPHTHEEFWPVGTAYLMQHYPPKPHWFPPKLELIH